MAELVLSAFLTVLFEKLASAALKNTALYKGIDPDMKKWQRSLDQIQNVLTDASQKEITNQSVKRWLNDLQHLAYDIDDVLDELATEAVHREFTREPEPITSKVRKLIPSCCTNFSPSATMHDKLDTITTKLQDLVEEKAALGLRVEEEVRPRINNNRRLQTSIVDASSIVGRQARKDELVHRLLLDEPCDQNFSIIPIVGMGGVGKTTLARLLYDEEQVKDHFKLKAWVCVSDEFDSFGISKVIYQSVVGAHKYFEDLNLLQVDLVNHLRGKKFLLVLDDVWTESYEDWETLVAPFHACASGSKIVMTTRKEQLLKQLGYDHLNKLEGLLHDDALSLFSLHALGVDKFDSHLSLKSHGEGIVKKCGGLPLALIALGKSLRAKKDEDSWKEVLESEIWKSKDGGLIIPALRLSYHDLSAHLKQLFAYCSLFPKDFLFDKKELVLLWMAEGFLHSSTQSDSKQEKLGHEYFDELLSRSFFQHAPNNESLFVMHDLMNDLATYVAGEFFVRLGNETETLKRYRHMSFVREYYTSYKKFEAFTRIKSLRTFLATPGGEEGSWRRYYISNQILVGLLPKLSLLRVLCLSDFRISEVPDSIDTLRHLRYLNLSRTEITNLPENICNLYNLETLILFGCEKLTKLPNSFLKLKNLRHLDIRDTPLLDQMPLGIDELKSLQTLSKIIIGGERGFKMAKLKDFKNLYGTISIVGLDKMQNAIHAREARFSEKRFSELEFVWSDASDGLRNEIFEKEVLNELKPGNDKLTQLKIISYEGLEFPNWVADPLFLRLKHVSILGCKRCISLPPLAQIPSLKELLVSGLYGVEVVGLELFGTSSAFRSLEILSFKDMPRWKNWSTNNGVMFPCLKQLVIRDCPKLVEVTLALPTLNVLEIIGCDSGLLRRLVEIASVVTKLKIEHILGLNDVMWRGVTEYLRAVEDLSIINCNEIKYLWESEAVASKVFVSLKKLEVGSCDNLVSLGEKEEKDSCRSNLLTSLRMLKVYECENMERCNFPDSIETLMVWQCNSITALFLPTGGQKLKTLYITGCNNLLEREWKGQKMNSRSSMSMLKDVRIFDWSNLKSIIEVNLLVHLTKLTISNCDGLESFPDNELSNLTSLKQLLITRCPSMNASFPRGVWPPNLLLLSIGKLKKPVSEWGPQNFPTSLSSLFLYGGEDGVSSCSQISHLLPSSLVCLQLTEFEKLESVSTGLQHLTSLQLLCFSDCPNIKDLPKVLFPSLLSLRIYGNCPILKEKCSKRGYYWPLISHIPCMPHINPEP